MAEDRRFNFDQPKEFDERVVQISRVSKKTKGGNKISFSALVVVGDRKGRVGAALGKAPDVSSAIRKAITQAKDDLYSVKLKGTTIPHWVIGQQGAARVMLKPAPLGTGVIAGGTVRNVLEVTGVRDIVGKVLGSRNKINNIYATMDGLKKLKWSKDKNDKTK
jgi:small subunit ribosomal protein S5